MGSIAAILMRSLPQRSHVCRMLAASPHRGTEVSWRACGNAVFGISNDPDSVDAAISAPGELNAVLAGSLHNAAELLELVTAAGAAPRTGNVADLLVSVFSVCGVNAAAKLRGNFAAIVTDGRRVWCMRDQLGLRPLFYRDDSRGFFAATEPKQVVAGAGLVREPDYEVLEQIFYGRMGDRMPSALAGVERLPKASTLTVGADKAGTPEIYWHPERLLETARMSLSDVRERFLELFDQAVGRCLTGADVVALSGGIDSPAVAAFAAPQHLRSTGKPLSALSVVFPETPRVDESPYIAVVTRHLGMTLHTCTLSRRAVDDLERWCELLDGPTPTINAPQMLEYNHQARRLGFRNVLMGDIAECVVDMPMHVAGHLLMHGRWRALASHLRTQRGQGASFKRLATQLIEPLVPGRLAVWYASKRGQDFPKRIPVWLDARTVNQVPYRSDLLISGRARWAAAQTHPLHGCPITIEASELCAGLAGVSVERPFGDVDLWEFFLSLPAEIKYPDLRSKTLLRKLLRGRVPDVVLDRRDKTYFDDHVMRQIDYPLLQRYLLNPKYRMPGVDYACLAGRLERRDFNLIDWFWSNDLVRIHAFLNQW